MALLFECGNGRRRREVSGQIENRSSRDLYIDE
jgi:hypothetical protein